MKYILEAYTWAWYWKNQDNLPLYAVAAFLGIIIAALVIAWFAFIKRDFQELNELENETSTKL